LRWGRGMPFTVVKGNAGFDGRQDGDNADVILSVLR